MNPLDACSIVRRVMRSSSRMRILPMLALLCLLYWPTPRDAAAQVSRCVDRSGHSVFTDRPCEAVDSASRVPRTGAARHGDSAYRGACARSLPALIRDLSAAIDSRDVNRLGMLYLWAGVSDAQAVRTFNRLQSIVERPLVDIVPLRREVTVAAPLIPQAAAVDVATGAETAIAASSATPGQPVSGAPAAESEVAASQPSSTGDVGPSTPSRTRTAVTGLRLEQTVGNRATPAQTMLGLRRAYDCWWISLSGS